MDTEDKVMVGCLSLKILLVIFLVIGWVRCIIKLVECDFASPYKAEVFYAIGCVAPPLGGIIGWINIGN